MDAAERVAEVLALVLERSPRPQDDLDRDALATLERHGLVSLASGEVRPGPRLLRFARSGHDRRDLVSLAEPPMRRLADESGETVNLMVSAARGAEALSQVDGRHVLGVSSWIGREVPDHCSAAGKLFLAFGTSTLPDGPLERRAPATLVDRDRLQTELESVRTQGFATIVDELEPGLAAVAAPDPRRRRRGRRRALGGRPDRAPHRAPAGAARSRRDRAGPRRLDAARLRRRPRGPPRPPSRPRLVGRARGGVRSARGGRCVDRFD